MTAPTDFAGSTFDFAVGEVFGLRVWRMDELGRLRARHIDGAPAWTPGVNHARCFSPGGASAVLGFMRQVYGSSVVPPSAHDVPEDASGTAAVEVPNEKCKCGFYAYTRETAESFEAGGVIGVIRRAGRTLIGAKGFRCQKAEIVAALDPSRDGRDGFADYASWQRAKLRQLYPDVPLLDSRQALLDFAPIDWSEPDPSDPDFWTAP